MKKINKKTIKLNHFISNKFLGIFVLHTLKIITLDDLQTEIKPSKEFSRNYLLFDLFSKSYFLYLFCFALQMATQIDQNSIVYGPFSDSKR